MKNHNIAIIDYGMGNLFSIASACKKVGLNPLISSDKKKIMDCSGIILPGVGAFNEAITRLNNLDLISTINQFVESGKQLFGICLGMQLLFSNSSEFMQSNGLGIIKGKVKNLNFLSENKAVKVPSIGWNSIFKKDRDWTKTYFNGLNINSKMYFVHSYYVEPEQSQSILSLSKFDKVAFCSAISHENIFATQFHPEKSGNLGLKIYSNFKKGL